MGGITYDYMERYIRDLIPENNDFLKELEEYAAEYNVPIIQKEGAQFLKTIVAIKKPKKVLELGTAIGYSALTIYQSNKCKITTIDRSADMVAKVGKCFFVPRRPVRIISAPANRIRIAAVMGSKGLPCCPFLALSRGKAGGTWRRRNGRKNMSAFASTADITAEY